MTERRVAGKEGLYIHVPFCAHKCEYCAFYSEAGSGELTQRYVAALARELELASLAGVPGTVFFGGGTPSILNLRQWRHVLQAMERLEFLGAAEWTVECNPATVSRDKAKLLRDFGVNRISMGVQSLDGGLLDRLGRIHSREQVFASFDILRSEGFDNLNLDLMFAIPGQTMEVWQQTLTEVLAMQSEHLSCYEVIYEQDTPLFAQLKAGAFDVDEDLACDMYEALVDRSAADGFVQYEVANFARPASPGRTAPGPVLDDPEIPAFACRHNVNYWRGGEYHGLGPSATGYVKGVRTRNWSNTQLYCDQIEKGHRAFEVREELPPLKRAGETAAFGLRMTAGWPFEEFVSVSGFDLRQEWQGEMAALVDRGWADRLPERFRLNRKGLRFADAAAEMFLR